MHNLPATSTYVIMKDSLVLKKMFK